MIFLGLGSNQGNREELLNNAKEKLKSSLKILKESKIYESEPWGEIDQPWFLNQVIAVETNLSAEELLQLINEIESSLGKSKTTKYGPRTIDIDILYYHELTINNQKLTLPHPRIKERNFILTPLKEIAPDFRDPLDLKSISELQSLSTDKSEVKVWTSNKEVNNLD